ncbi:MAG: hypothetical protein AAGH15_19265 [Myxococcota bacterium]
MNSDTLIMLAPFLLVLSGAIAAAIISARDEKAYYARKAARERGEHVPEPESATGMALRRLLVGAGDDASFAERLPEPPATEALASEAAPAASPKPPPPEPAPAPEPVPAAAIAPLAPAGGFTVLRRWTVKAELEEAFRRAWNELTEELRADHCIEHCSVLLIFNEVLPIRPVF